MEINCNKKLEGSLFFPLCNNSMYDVACLQVSKTDLSSVCD